MLSDQAKQVATEDIDGWSDAEVADYLHIAEDEVNYAYRQDAIQLRTDYYIDLWK
jgi:DNA-directed RNA polymerase specialized sigma24 family protein